MRGGSQGLRNARLALRLASRADARKTRMVLFLSAVESVADATPPLWLKLVVDALMAGHRGRAILFALALSGSYLSGTIARNFNYIFFRRLELQTQRQLDEELIQQVGDIGTIEHHERTDHIDRLQLLRANRELVVTYMRSLAGSLSTVIRVIAAVVLFLEVHPVLLVLPLFAVPSLLLASRAQRIDQDTAEVLAPDQRLSAHLLDLPTKAASGTEVRVFGLTEEVIRRHQDLVRSIWRRELPRLTMSTSLRAAGTTVFTLGYVAAVGFVVYLVTQRKATVGDVVLAITLAADMSWITEAAASVVSVTSAAVRAMERYGWLSDYSERAKGQQGKASAPQAPLAIKMRGVTFHYPGTESAVLEDVNLDLTAGSTVAIVGENGAGKTTLVKLLCGLYHPDEGEILVDGMPLSAIDPMLWRQRVSAAFQDFVKFEFLARETVGVGEVSRISDDAAVLAALERAAATDVVRSLSRGLETQLGKSWPEGAELSGGQWQKLALGRALMRSDPFLLVLDEPTASLDADTELQLFQRYAQVSKATGDTVTLLASHRFSTVRMADHIVVLDKGRVVEEGTHDQLMDLHGTYAALYELQARQYR